MLAANYGTITATLWRSSNPLARAPLDASGVHVWSEIPNLTNQWVEYMRFPWYRSFRRRDKSGGKIAIAIVPGDVIDLFTDNSVLPFLL